MNNEAIPAAVLPAIRELMQTCIELTRPNFYPMFNYSGHIHGISTYVIDEDNKPLKADNYIYLSHHTSKEAIKIIKKMQADLVQLSEKFMAQEQAK